MTALLTANIGDIDSLQRLENQSLLFHAHYYGSYNLPFPLPNLNDRMKGKYIKINTHRFLPDYPNYVWIDGRVAVISSNFIEKMTENLDEYDVVIGLHPQRNNVYEEISFIKKLISEGNEYLLARYKNEPFDLEEQFYRSEGLPEDTPLYACTVFARNNNEKVNAAFEDWWLRTLEFTCFDQAMFSYIVWKHRLKVKAIPYIELLNYVTVGKHKVVK